ncbi:MAG: tRNA(Met) cytidine acetyltransferase [Crenarchaeota archaeon]|nr:tRNA(Met) cytidine acetyltransferase [Thermoproteota archaeon]
MEATIREMLEKFMEQGILLNHRRMIVLSGDSDEKLIDWVYSILDLFSEVWKRCRQSTPSGLYMYQHDASGSCRRFEFFRRKLSSLSGKVEIEHRPYKDTDKLLGSTYDFTVMDIIDNLKPNDIGRLGGVVRGGGIYIMLVRPLESWVKFLTKFQEQLLVPQYGPQDVRHLLKKRLWKKFYEHDGICIIDVDSGRFLKEPKILEKVEPWRRPDIKIPDKRRFPTCIYKLALTQDQVNALKVLEVILDRPKKGEKTNVIIIADRGRGKSAVIGLAVAAFCHKLRRVKGIVRVAVTAMNLTNVMTLMEFVVRGLKELRYDPIVEKDSAGFIRTVRVGAQIFVDYYRPYSLLSEDGIDLVVVDEAAMVPLPVLYGIHARYSRVVYASTIHGYEGAGRGFSLRFLKYLRERKDTRVYEYEMHEPIRYAPNDPVERWLFDTFLLDAEPAKIDKEDLKYVESKEGLIYLAPDLEKLALEEEDKLRQFFGIYVQAHYRNEPDDLGMMLDAPHHFIRALALPNGKIVVAVELAEEGGISDEIIDVMTKGLKLPGNIIPDRLVKYWKLTDFAKLRGWRIVRIATHPELQDRGLGSHMLKLIEKEARERGIDWVGVGFGVHERLLKFWIKNEYKPVHMSPERNPVSGEYSVLLVRPITEQARRDVDYANREFRLRIVNSLHGPYHDLEPEVAVLLLTDWNIPLFDNIDECLPKISEAQLNRLVAYAYGPMTYENAVDGIFELCRKYYYQTSSMRPKLPFEYEKMIIAKVLQARPWKEAALVCGTRKVTIMLALREIVKILLHHYYGDKISIPLYMVGITKRLTGPG